MTISSFFRRSVDVMELNKGVIKNISRTKISPSLFCFDFVKMKLFATQKKPLTFRMKKLLKS